MSDSKQLIEALKKGREKYPKRGCGYLFSAKMPMACALGAIAVGLGYEPDFGTLSYDSDGYTFLDRYISPNIRGEIIGINDGSFTYDGMEGRYIEKRNPDAAVIKYLESI